METNSRYIIGIDLGTTNSALAFVDTAVPVPERRAEVLRIPQLIAPGEVGELETLPSFVYLPEPGRMDPELLRLPWHEAVPPDFAVGALAREMAARAPGAVVSSAKSWLSCATIDRRAPTLPFDRRPVPRQISPVQASRLYLEHFRDAWNCLKAGDDPGLRLEVQQVFLTVPASFDAVARQLTVEAAAEAGLQVQLLEEPQAAFYAWLLEQGDAWREHVAAGDAILVCDIGGGTTDFSLVAVTDVEGNLGLERIAVGDHILLGGDNMDLALAYRVAQRLRAERGLALDGRQLAALTHACRAAKEKLSSDTPEPQRLTVLGVGSGVVGGAVTTELRSEEMRDTLLDGFFPTVDITDQPASARRIGLRTFGLDYASDPGVTRHLAAFLSQHSFRDASGRPILPTAVLFNGGVTKSPVFRERIIRVLNRWAGESAAGGADILRGSHPDLAVALGAAWYGQVRREGGVRIKSGSARSYYLGVESSLPAVPGFPTPLEALCVVNFGMEEGSRTEVPSEGLGLIVGEITEFRFFSSTRRTGDHVGDVLSAWGEDELRELPPLTAELPVREKQADIAGTLVPVRVEAVLTEVGTLEIWCQDRRGTDRWKLEFDLRAVESDDSAGSAPESTDNDGSPVE
ncbi:MAG: Hsp70 family protein [Kiritimatiellaeota bacterium]|nr:Hsp70 family protein [Kiritimatiellota bacterium]